jgi:signal transduction histidine kinase
MDNLSREINIIIVSSIFLIIVAVGIIILVLIYQKKQLQFIQEKEQFKILLEKEILEAQLEIQELTLKHISEEIHDNIGQTLSLAKLNLNTINLDQINSIEDKISTSKELVSKAILDLRTLSKTLNTDTILSAGLLKAIEFEIAVLNKAGVFKTDLTIIGTPLKIYAQKELIIFRIFQEALNNIIKHSKAEFIHIEVDVAPQLLILTISDDGNGFVPDFENNDLKSGSGLKNMRNRAELIGGSFEIESNFNRGTIIKVKIPTSEI